MIENIIMKKRNMPIVYEYSNRLEPRLKFAMKDMKLHSMNHKLIMKELKRYRFITDTNAMNIDRWRKNRIRKMQQNYKRFLLYSAKEQREIRKALKDNRGPLEQYYNAHRAKLFNFLATNQVAESTGQPANAICM